MSESNSQSIGSQPVSHFGVFWDIENCRIPGGTHASNVVNYIRLWIKNKYSKNTECIFCCSCDTRKLDERQVEALNRSGVDILHVNCARTPNKVNADSKLMEGIQKFIDHHNYNSIVFVITGDVDFAPTVRTAIRNGFQVILIYSQNTSHELRNLASESYSFSQIVSKAERDSNNGNNVQNNSNVVVTTTRLPQITPNIRPSNAITSQLAGIQSHSTNEWISSTQSHSSGVRQNAIQQPVRDVFSDVNELIEQRMNNLRESAQNRGTNSEQSNNRSIQEINRSVIQNDSNSQQLSPEFAAKVDTIISITGVERHLAINILQVYKGNVELAINSLYSD